MPNGTYGGVRGKETKVGQKTFVFRPTRYTLNMLGCNALGKGRTARVSALNLLTFSPL